jgi:hypothetical protein
MYSFYIIAHIAEKINGEEYKIYPELSGTIPGRGLREKIRSGVNRADVIVCPAEV